MLRDLFLGFIRIHILYHASTEPVFGLDLIRELASHGYTLSPGTIYPILHGMESQGWLSASYVVVLGKRRKYYSITEAGKSALSVGREKAWELINEIAAAPTEQSTIPPVGRKR